MKRKKCFNEKKIFESKTKTICEKMLQTDKKKSRNQTENKPSSNNNII